MHPIYDAVTFPPEHSMPKETLKEVGIWIRVSTEEQAEGDSPEYHEKRARYYAETRARQCSK